MKGWRSLLRIIWNFVLRDLKGRYAGSIMGIFWAVVHPLLLLLLYTFVFSFALRIRVGAEVGTEHFPLFLAAGLIPWIAFQESLSRSATSILDHANLIKRLAFPSEVLAPFLVFSGFLHQCIGLAVLVVFLGIMGDLPGPQAVVLLGLFPFQILFTLGLAWLLSVVLVYIRDLGQLLGPGLTAWFFLTPVVYPLTAVPDGVRWWLSWNPLAILIEMYRGLLLRGELPSLGTVAGFAILAFVILGVGYTCFMKAKGELVDLV